jgi:hypothetical protein
MRSHSIKSRESSEIFTAWENSSLSLDCVETQNELKSQNNRNSFEFRINYIATEHQIILYKTA